MLNNKSCTENRRYPFFDYIKGFAILLIIITHYEYTYFERLHVVFPYVVDMAVPIFMLVTGFLYSNSYIKKDFKTLKEMYCPDLMIKRILRLIIPVLIIFTLMYILNNANLRTNGEFFAALFNGKYGPGSYYIPVILQIVLIFPFIHLLLIKYKSIGFAIILFIEFIYMLLAVKFNINSILFRSLAFRFLTLLSMGSILAIYRPNIKDKYLLLSLFIGASCIFVNYYTVYKYFTYPYIPQYWGLTSGFVTMLYIFPIFYWFYEYFINKEYNNCFTKLISIIGKASWHIFLVQMFYFLAIDTHLYKILPPVLHVITNILVCTTAGIVFYLTENRIKFLLFKNKI